MKMNVVIAFGNPLLDNTVSVNQDDDIFKLFDELEKDDQKEINAEDMRKVLALIKQKDKRESPGGCAQNTLRVMQWLFRHQFSATMIGAVGNDDIGLRLKSLLEKDGVETKYIVHSNYATGSTVALISGVYRTLLAHVGAAEHFDLEDLSSDIIRLVHDADLIYMEGFFITKRTKVARKILDSCKEKRKTFAFNISGKYVCALEPANVIHFVENSDILFGNRVEFDALTSLMNFQSRNCLIRDLLTSQPCRIIVMTDGGKSVICGWNRDNVEEIPVPDIDMAEIVDTTGAGDAFVGGFLTGWILKRSPSNCVELGCYAAQEIIKRTGCILPEYPPSVQL